MHGGGLNRKHESIPSFRFTRHKHLGEKIMKAIVCTKYGEPEVLQLKNLNREQDGDHSFIQVQFNETYQYRSIKGV